MKIRDSLETQKAANALGNSVSHWLKDTDPTHIWPTCATCMHLAKDDRTCSKYKAQPPVSVVVRGCQLYEDMEQIPYPNPIRSARIPRTIDDDIPF